MPEIPKAVTSTLIAQNTYTDWISAKHANADGYLNFSLSGTWVGTLTLQRSFDSGVTQLDVSTFTSNYEGSLTDYGNGVIYRVGFKTGGYTSGAAICSIIR